MIQVQMVNTSKGPMLYQTGEIYANDNGKFYQVDKDQLYNSFADNPIMVECINQQETQVRKLGQLCTMSRGE